MEDDQRNARIFGVLFIITFITSIPALALYQPVLDNPAAYIAGGGEDSKIYLGVLLELLLIIANIGDRVPVLAGAVALALLFLNVALAAGFASFAYRHFTQSAQTSTFS